MKLRSVWFAFLLCQTALAAEETVDCSIDKKALLALDEHHFDQDMSNGGGGWRALESKHGCEQVAADIIKEYRVVHHSESYLLYWHEGQLRASHGDYQDAIPLLEKARKPPEEDSAGWNAYVDATVAFLQKDRAALDRARKGLIQTQPSGGIVVKNGFMEAHMQDGSVKQIAWPMNLDVVDGLRKCFDKPYSEAYGSDKCRK